VRCTLTSVPDFFDSSFSDFNGIGVYISCDTPEKAGTIKMLIQLALEDGLKVRPNSDYELYDESANDAVVLEVA
jgi:hypothetical protein